MKSFLEEYGFAILAAIVVILLIAMCTPVGNLIKNQVMGVVESFAGKTESKLANADAGDKTLRIKQTAKGGLEVNYEIASPSDTDTFKLEYRIKTQAGWGKYEALSGKGAVALADRSGSVDLADATVAPNLGNAVQFRMIDNGTGEIVESNIVDLLS